MNSITESSFFCSSLSIKLDGTCVAYRVESNRGSPGSRRCRSIESHSRWGERRSFTNQNESLQGALLRLFQPLRYTIPIGSIRIEIQKDECGWSRYFKRLALRAFEVAQSKLTPCWRVCWRDDERRNERRWAGGRNRT